MKPIRNKIIVHLDKEEPIKTTKSGLFYYMKEPWQVTQSGITLAVGDDAKDLTPGDRVHVTSHQGTEFHVSDEKYLIIEEDKVLAKEE